MEEEMGAGALHRCETSMIDRAVTYVPHQDCPRGYRIYLFAVILLLFFSDRAWFIKLLSFELLGRINPFSELANVSSLILFGMTFIFIRRSPITRSPYLLIIVSLFFCIAISFLFGSVPNYGQDPWRIGRVLFWFSGILIFFYLINKHDSSFKAEKVFQVIVKYGVAASLLSIMIVLFPPLRDIVSEDIVSERFSLVRVARIAEDSINLAVFYFLATFFVASNKPKALIERLINSLGLVMTLGSILFINISRQRIIGTFISIALLSFLSLRLRDLNKKAGIVTLSMICLLFLLIVVLPYAYTMITGNIVETLNIGSAKSSEGISLSLRIKGIEFYWKELIYTNFVGVGWISIAEGMPENEITRATNIYMLKLTDLGALGTFFQYGPLGLAVLVFFFITAWKHVGIVYRQGSDFNKIIAVTFGLFFLMKACSLNYLFFWPDFCIFYGIVMYILDVIVRSCEQPKSVCSIPKMELSGRNVI